METPDKGRQASLALGVTLEVLSPTESPVGDSEEQHPKTHYAQSPLQVTLSAGITNDGCESGGSKMVQASS